MPSSFTSLADQFLKVEYEASPVLASALGLTEYDERLDDLSADAIARKEQSDAEWLGRLRAVPDEGLPAEDLIDRDFLVSILRGREILRPHRMWQRQPAAYLNPGSQGVFSLFLHRIRPERDLAEAARARLEQVPRAIEAGIANLDFALVPPVYLERGIGQARATVRYARELVPNEVRDPKQRERLAAAGDAAATAIERFAQHLETNRAKAAGDYAVGEDVYSALLREKELL